MPIYEYGCTECGFELEKLQKLNDPPLTDCPACQMHALRKKVSAAGFRLKGSGWYETDFKQGSKKNLADSPDKSTKDTGKKDSGGSTPATKSDSKKGEK